MYNLSMHRFLLSVLLIFALLIFAVQSVSAAQFFPKPGINCGVPYPGFGEDINTPPNLSPDQTSSKYACCYDSSIIFVKQQSDNAESILRRAIDWIPGLPNKEAIIELFNPWNFPGSFLPIDGLPKVSDIVDTSGISDPENLCPMGGLPNGDPDANQCYCKRTDNPVLTSIMSLCGNITDDEELKRCVACLGYDSATKTFKEGGIWTALGCIKPSFTSFIQEVVFGIGIGFAGLVSLGCIIYASIMLQISQGDPEKVQAARDMIQSCIFGLLLIIFSVFILRVIGVDILRIPGFS